MSPATGDAPSAQAVPGGHARDQYTGEQDEATRELPYRDPNGKRKRGRCHNEREDRRQSPFHRATLGLPSDRVITLNG